MTSDTQDAVRRRFNRRYTFALNAFFSGITSIVVFFIAFAHSPPLIFVKEQVFLAGAGYARPDLMYVGSLLVGFIGIHGSWLLWRESKLNKRRFALLSHVILALVSVALIIFFIKSWYFDDPDNNMAYYNPASPAPAGNAVLVAAILLATVLFSLIPHVIWSIHRELLARALRRSHDDNKPKMKREEVETVIGDDGELADWAAQEMQAKQQG